MEQQLAKIVQEAESRQGPTSLPESSFRNLPVEDQRILSVKHQGKPFCLMAPEEIDLLGDVLMLKINAITGWQVPEGALLEVLGGQFKKKIAESYGNTTPDEIEYAFRNYGTAIEDWGKQMNLNMIDKVMIPYLGRRAELSKLEGQQVKEIEGPKEDLSDHAMSDWLAETAKKVKAGGYSVQFIPLMIYDWLEKSGMLNLSNAEKREYLVKAVEYQQGRLVEDLEKMEGREPRARLTEFMAMKAAGEFTGEYVTSLPKLAKRMILYNHILYDL